MSKPLKSGKTRRAELEGYKKATGRTPHQLTDHGECPEGFEWLWNAFSRLCAARASSFSIQPLQYIEMDAFARLNRVAFEPWHVETLERLDAAWMLSRMENHGN